MFMKVNLTCLTAIAMGGRPKYSWHCL